MAMTETLRRCELHIPEVISSDRELKRTRRLHHHLRYVVDINTRAQAFIWPFGETGT